MKVRGFTIAEALIVLAIIAIMSYLLFPLFMKVKRYGQIHSSASKLRQIHVVIENYRQAWDGADVFTSYKSFYRLGLPPGSWFDYVRELWYPMRPWQYTETTPRDWWSPCATGIHEYDVNIIFATDMAMVPPGYIESSAHHYSPIVIELPKYKRYEGFVAGEPYKDYIPRYRQNIVVARDPYCNPPGTPMDALNLPKRGLAVLLSGQIVNREAKGDPRYLQWWSDPPED